MTVINSNHTISWRRLGTRVLGGSLAIVAFAACGDDGPGAADEELAAGYCASVASINAHAEEIFGALYAESDGEEPPIEAVFDAEREVLAFIDANGFDEQELPSAIAGDYRVFIDGFRAKLAADVPEPPSVEAQQAEERLLAWEEQHCA